MVARLLDNCAVRITTVGTGTTLALGDPVQIGKQYMLSFADAGAEDGETYAFRIVDGSGWSWCSGAYSEADNTIERITRLTHDGRTVSTDVLSLSGRAWLAVALSADDLATTVQMQDAIDASAASAADAAASAATAVAGITSKVTGPASATANAIMLFDGATGKLAKDGVKLLSDLILKAGDTMTGPLNWKAAVSVASATTCDIGAATSNLVNITGTTTITNLGTAASGVPRWVKFAGALTLTYNATSLILPGAASITTAAGDTGYFVSEGSGNWRCMGYQKASGAAVAAVTPGIVHLATSTVSAVTAVDFETGINSTGYAYHIIDFRDVVCSSVAPLAARFKKSGAYVTGATYYYTRSSQTGDTAVTLATTAAQTEMLSGTNLGSAANDRQSGRIILRGALLTAAHAATVDWELVQVNSSTGSHRRMQATGSESTAAAVTGLRLTPTGGATITGTFDHYGVLNT